MKTKLRVKEIIDIIVDKGLITEKVGDLMLSSDSGQHYDNILTDDNAEPTEFFVNLMKISNIEFVQTIDSDSLGIIGEGNLFEVIV